MQFCLRACLRLLCGFFSALLLLDLACGASAYGAALGALLVASCVLFGRTRPPTRRRMLGAVAAWALLLGYRTIAAANSGISVLEYATDPAHPASTTRPALAYTLLPEQDIVLAAATTLRTLQRVGSGWSGANYADLDATPTALAARYAELSAAHAAAPSLLIPAYLRDVAGDAGPTDDALLVHAEYTENMVVYLHGSAGPFTLPCFQVSRAAAAERFGTVCPSSGFIGDWRTRGPQRMHALIANLRARGAKRVVLVGLSNGGFAALRLAPTLAASLAGVVVVSAAHAGSGPAPGLHPLTLCGREDPVCAGAAAASYSQSSGGKFISTPGGHFAMAVHPDAYEPHIRVYLQDVAARPARAQLSAGATAR